MTNIGYAGLTGSALRLQKEEKASISVMRLSHADMEVYTDFEKEPCGISVYAQPAEEEVFSC